MDEKKHPFIKHLEELRDDRNSRGALAALRRGLGQPPGTVPAMFPYVERYLPEDVNSRQEMAYYLVAALFAYHPDPGGHGNVGHHFADVRRKNPGSDDTALERRFTALLAAHRDDLTFYLRQTVSFLKSKEVPVNWNQLFRDIQHWGYESRSVQKRWARAFWGRESQA
jgi:CRISPR system Cascade subunit CasB